MLNCSLREHVIGQQLNFCRCDKLVSIVPNLVGTPVHLARVDTTEKQVKFPKYTSRIH